MTENFGITWDATEVAEITRDVRKETVSPGVGPIVKSATAVAGHRFFRWFRR